MLTEVAEKSTVDDVADTTDDVSVDAAGMPSDVVVTEAKLRVSRS